jgi:hypothetical protein
MPPATKHSKWAKNQQQIDRRFRPTYEVLQRHNERRTTKSLDALLPVLYLRGVSTGDFQGVLAALLGKDAPISPARR